MMEMLFTARARRLGKIYLGIHTVYVGKNIKAEAAYGLGRKPNLSFIPEGVRNYGLQPEFFTCFEINFLNKMAQNYSSNFAPCKLLIKQQLCLESFGQQQHLRPLL
jgi:hypothetical protein